MYNEVDGDLITLAFQGKFDVIVQGNNCFNTQGSGLAPQFVKAFGTDKFKMELSGNGDINKLGQIDYQLLYLEDNKWTKYPDEDGKWVKHKLYVVNSYTQYNYGAYRKGGSEKPVDYDAITMVMKKINHIFKGMHIGIPYVIGAGLAGGNPGIIIDIIKRELKDMRVTMVKLNK